MTATINASTTAGVVTTADTSGILQLQTNGTAALTVDASQNVGIGTASPANKLHVNGTGDSGRFQGTSRSLYIATDANASAIWNGAGQTGEGVYLNAASNQLDLYTGSTVKARIDSSGNVGIGVTPAFKLDVSGGGTTAKFNTLDTYDGGTSISTWQKVGRRAGTGTNAYINTVHSGSDAVSALTWAFGTSGTGTEAMRLDSSGNFMVGNTSATQTEKLGVYQTANFPAIFINPSFATFNGTVIYTNTTRAASSAFDFIGCYGNNVGQFRVQGSGVIYAQNTSVQSISDQRLKENIRDSSDGLSVISGLRPVRYDWKEGHGNNQKNQLGFIAQEIETVFPEAVSEWQVDKNDETVYKTVGPGALIPVLVKAIQELKAIVDAQGAEIAALKGATA